MSKFRLIVIVFFALFIGTSCRELTNAQKASKIAKKRYKYIKHDCNCHSYLYYQDSETAEI